MNITILLADDHPVVRQGLRGMLEAEQDFSVVGQAADGLEAVEKVERLQPSVLITDLMMPSLNGLEVARQVSQRFPKTRTIVLSMYTNERYVLEALKNGATGYVLKQASGAIIVQAVRTVAAGGRYLCPPLVDRAIEAYLEKVEDMLPDAYDTLTAREREVLQLAVEGCNNPQIAERLAISRHTVEIHRARFMHKLGLHTQTDLIRFALRRGILTLE